MNHKTIYLILILGLLLTACQAFFSPPTPIPSPTSQPTLDLSLPSPFPTDTPSLIEPVTATPTETPLETPTPTPTNTPDPLAEPPQEAIMILEPAPGSRVASPVRVSGYADPTFEQNLLIRIILDDGSQLPVDSTIIQADIGERGYFEFQYHFVRGGQGFIQVFDLSARDGGIIHLSSVGVILDPTGTPEIITREPYNEQIIITNPSNSATIRGGAISVEGVAIASFEQTLVVDILNEDGNIISTEIVTLDSEFGEYGMFHVEIAYRVNTPQPGRVVVRDPSPAFPGDLHLNSVEVTLEP
jgi:hypothetical protein